MNALFALLALANVQDAEDLRPLVDVRHYHLDLTVDPEEEVLSGEVTTRATVLADELTGFQLDAKSHLDIDTVVMGEKELGFAHIDGRLYVPLVEPAKKGDTLEITVRYEGRMKAPEGAFGGFHWVETADGRPWINTSCQGTGAHDWWPCKASYYHPDDKPDEGVRFDITVPEDLYAVSNGVLKEVSEPEDGRRTFRWEHPYPLETYSITLNVAPYVVVESELELPGVDGAVPWIYYVLPENAEKAAVQFEQVPELLRIFSDAFGPWPFPDAKFALVETNFWGMEHSTAVAYGSSYPAWCEANDAEDRYAGRNRYFDYILVHEVAHEWWGNAVSATDWGHFWIHEGFGTYAEGVYVEMTQGRERADDYFAGTARRIGKESRLFRGENVDSRQAYSGVIYSKGAAVLNTLRHYLDDDEVWWNVLRDFNARFRYGNASTEDFRAVLEEHTELDWKRFFDEWFYGQGYPQVKAEVRVEGKRILVSGENEGSGENGFLVPIDLVWTEEGEPQGIRLWFEAGPFERGVDCAHVPEGVEVVNMNRVLGRHDVRVK